MKIRFKAWKVWTEINFIGNTQKIIQFQNLDKGFRKMFRGIKYVISCFLTSVKKEINIFIIYIVRGHRKACLTFIHITKFF